MSYRHMSNGEDIHSFVRNIPDVKRDMGEKKKALAHYI